MCSRNRRPVSSSLRRPATVAALLALSVLAAACGGSAATPAPTEAAATPATVPSATPATVPSATPATAAPTEAPATPAPASVTVRLALDWTPNTNHTGFYVADQEGWYADAGVRLEVLPYGGTAPEAVLAAHQAECGISFQDSLTFAAAAGAPVVSVMAILQHTAQEIAVLDSSSIERPKQLDGRTYAGFGYPNEVPTLQSVIRADGGTGEFDSVMLDTAAYEALYSRRADFVITFTAWEGIEAGQRGIGLRTFKFTDYGFPDFYQVVLACDREWLDRDPVTAKAFVAATVKGFEYATTNPQDAAAKLIAANPGVFDANPALAEQSAVYMATQGLLVDAAGKVGTQTLDEWTGYSKFLYEQGLLTDASGNALTAAPDYASLFTNDVLP